MHLRKLFVVAAASLCVGAGAMAQTDAATPAQPDASTGAPAKPSKKKKKSGKKKSSKKSSRKKKSSAPAAAAPAPEPQVPDDGEPPQLTHQFVAAGVRGKPLTIAAHAIDANGVFGPILSVRKKGLGAGDYVPIKMAPSKIVPGDKEYKALPMGNIGGDDYTATIPAAMTTSDLEYYVEAFDQYGNGPARSGAPNVPYALRIMDPAPAAVPAPAPVALGAQKRTLDEEPERTIIGLGIDGGAPGGGGLTLLVRPLWWLRLNGGLAYNAIRLGDAGGISLSPADWAVTPTLNLDAGRYLSGDMTKFVTVSDPTERVLLSKTTYTFATAQLGLEFGSQRRFRVLFRGGVPDVFRTPSGRADTTHAAPHNSE